MFFRLQDVPPCSLLRMFDLNCKCIIITADRLKSAILKY